MSFFSRFFVACGLVTVIVSSVRCTPSGQIEPNSVFLDGTFVAETENDYVKMVSFHPIENRLHVLSIVHHSLPALDMKKAMQGKLSYSHSGGSLGPLPISKQSSLPGGSSIAGNVTSDIEFYPVDENRVQYRVRSWHNPSKGYFETTPDEEMSGFLIKADPQQVISFYSVQSKSLEKNKADTAILTVGEKFNYSDAPITVNEEFCQKYFLNNCESLIKVGLFNQPASKLGEDDEGKSEVPSVDRGKKPQGPLAQIDTDPIKKSPGSLNSPPSGDKILPIQIDPPGTPNEKPYPYIKIDKDVDAKKYVDQATVVCEDESDCNENAALLIGSDGQSVFQCSATYLGHGYFSSNSHCVPSNLIGRSSYSPKCQGSIWVKLPKIATLDGETHECSKIVMATLMNENSSPKESRDILIFKVESSVQRSGQKADWTHVASAGESVSIWPSDPDRSQPGIHGVIRKKVCQISDKRNLNRVLDYFKWVYPISYLDNCSEDIIKGNSGSSAMNQENQAVVLISHTFGKETGEGIGSNYVCSDWQLVDSEMQTRSMTHCRWISEDSHKELLNRILAEDSAKEKAEVQKFYDKYFSLSDEFVGKDYEIPKDIYDRYFSFDYLSLRKEIVGAHEDENLDSIFKSYYSHGYTSHAVKDVAPILYTTSNRTRHIFKKYRLLGETGIQFEYISLPKCIGPIDKRVLNAYRGDNTWNPFDKTFYLPIKVTLPIGFVKQARWDVQPKALTPEQVDQLHYNFLDSKTLPVTTGFEVTISDYYNQKTGKLKKPNISLKEVEFPIDGAQRLKEYWFAEQVEKKLQNLDFCPGQ